MRLVVPYVQADKDDSFIWNNNVVSKMIIFLYIIAFFYVNNRNLIPQEK